MSDITEKYQEAFSLEQGGETEKAIELYIQVANASEKNLNSRYRIAVIYYERGDFIHALDFTREALKLAPKHMQLNFLLAECMWFTNQHELCIRHLNFILQLNPTSLEINKRLALRLFEVGKLIKSLKYFSIARKLDPDDLQNLKQYARALFYVQHFDESIKLHEEYLAKAPHDAEAHFLYGTLLLSLNNTKKAWEHYFWRHKYIQPHFVSFKKSYEQWIGQSLENKTILITWEQGIGDTIHFARYIKHLVKMGANVIFDLQSPLLDLFSSFDKHVLVHDTSTPQPNADYILSVMDIPYALRNNDIEDIEVGFPYLYAPTDLIHHFKEKTSSCKGFKIGIAWQGNPDYPRDAVRSIPLEAFNEIAAIKGVDLISLQAIFGTEQLETFSHPILDLEKALLEGERGISRLAAAIETLDLIICCDSAGAHIAGALNKPVWILIPTLPDWRWGWKSTTSILYPSMKIVRCPEGANWYSVISSIIPSLEEYIHLESAKDN